MLATAAEVVVLSCDDVLARKNHFARLRFHNIGNWWFILINQITTENENCKREN